MQRFESIDLMHHAYEDLMPSSVTVTHTRADDTVGIIRRNFEFVTCLLQRGWNAYENLPNPNELAL